VNTDLPERSQNVAKQNPKSKILNPHGETRAKERRFAMVISQQLKFCILLVMAVTVCSPPAFGQLSPSTLNFSVRYQDSPPYFQTTVVTGGAPTFGSCSPGGFPVLCNGFVNYVDPSCVSNCTVYIFFDNNYVFDRTPGVYPLTVTITASGACASGCPLNINVTINNLTDPVFQFPSGGAAPANCTNPGSPYRDLANCPMLVGPGAAGYLPLATLGATEHDPELGTLVTRITPAGTQRAVCGDAIINMFSPDKTLVCTQSIAGSDVGTLYLTNTNGTGDAYTVPGSQGGGLMFDPTLPYFYYEPTDNSNRVMRSTWTNNFATPTTVCTCDSAHGCSSGQNLTNSSDGNVNLVGFLSLIAPTDKKVVLCNVYTGAVYTYDFSGIVTMTSNGTLRNTTRVAPNFDVNNVLQIKADGESSPIGLDEQFFSYTRGGTSITNVGPEPMSPDAADNNESPPGILKIQPTVATDCTFGGRYCPNAEHSCIFQALVGGQPHNFNFALRGSSSPSWYVPSAQDLTAVSLPLINVAKEAGGGRYAMNPTDHANEDQHFSCGMLSPVAIAETDGDKPDGPTVYAITGITTGSSTTITVASTTGLSIGNPLLMSPAAGVTLLNVVNRKCTVAAPLTGTTFNCNGLVTSGSWTGATVAAPAEFIVDTAPTYNTHQSETVLWDFTGIGLSTPNVIMRRLYQHGSRAMSDRYGIGYYFQPHTSLSADGSMAATGGNRGVPDNYYVVVYRTGYVPSSTSQFTGNNVFTGKNVIQ
jgi:hypothetical protein